MMQRYISRRDFIAKLSAISMVPLVPSNINASISENAYIAALATVMTEQAELNNAFFSDGAKDNLIYAYRKIKPRNHQETAFVVACGSQVLPVRYLVDDYVRRRSGSPTALPDHHLLLLQGWGLPESHRILIFREQLISLLEELTGQSGEHVNRLFSGLLRNTMAISAAVLNEKYRNELTQWDISMLNKAFLCYAPFSRPYAWCSTMAERAEKLLA